MYSQRFEGWTATLSNGDIAWEQPPIAGEKSAWQKLLDRLDKEKLTITSLRIQRGRITLHALPQESCNGYYQAYEQFMSSNNKLEYLRQGCGSVIGDKIFIQWIDENGNVWSDIRPLQADKIHTTVRNT